MTVGVLRVTLLLHGCFSLKEKRSRVRPILNWVREKFHVAAAEVDRQNTHDVAVVAFATVSGSDQVANGTCDKILDYVESLGLAEMGPTELELIRM